MGFRPLHIAACPLIQNELPIRLRYRSVKNGQSLKRIHRQQDRRAYRGENLLLVVALANSVQKGTFIEVTQRKQIVHSIYDIKQIQKVSIKLENKQGRVE